MSNEAHSARVANGRDCGSAKRGAGGLSDRGIAASRVCDEIMNTVGKCKENKHKCILTLKSLDRIWYNQI